MAVDTQHRPEEQRLRKIESEGLLHSWQVGSLAPLVLLPLEGYHHQWQWETEPFLFHSAVVAVEASC